MEKHLSAGALHYANVGGLVHNFHFITLEPDMMFEHLFMPQFWAHHRGTIKTNDLVRARAHDGSFDVMLAVVDKPSGGIVMDLWPKYPGVAVPAVAQAATVLAKSSKPTVVSLDKEGNPRVRVDFTKVTGWRVRGIDGNEVSRQHANETVAIDAMNAYMAELGLVMPSDEVIAAAKAAAKAAATPKQKTSA